MRSTTQERLFKMARKVTPTRESILYPEEKNNGKNSWHDVYVRERSTSIKKVLNQLHSSDNILVFQRTEGIWKIQGYVVEGYNVYEALPDYNEQMLEKANLIKWSMYKNPNNPKLSGYSINPQNALKFAISLKENNSFTRNTKQQIQQLYGGRSVNIFPPSGLSYSDSFFAKESKEKSRRKY